MARSITTFSPKWRNGKTTVIRVPEVISAEILAFAERLDAETDLVREPCAVYKTASEVDAREPVNVAAVPHRSPFRYPGGKTWLVPYVRTWLRSTSPSILVEPFAGGGTIGLTACCEDLVSHSVLVEKDPAVAAVWRTMLAGQAEWLAAEIESFEFTEANVKARLQTPPHSQREQAFVTILRNRVQRGGIMAAGAGLVKNGENGKGMSSRWYPATLARRIRAIAMVRHKLFFFEGDGLEIIKAYADDENAAFFVDPPYTLAARRLYTHWSIDHGKLLEQLKQVKGSVLLTYDNSREIREIATSYGFDVEEIVMKNSHHAQQTELLIGDDLSWLRAAQASSQSKSRTSPAKRVLHR